MNKFFTRTFTVLSLLLLITTAYYCLTLPTIYAKLLSLFEIMTKGRNIIVCVPFLYLLIKPFIKIQPTFVLLGLMALGIFYNLLQFIQREDYLEPGYVLRLFNSYNLGEISGKSPNAIARNKFSLYFGLREFLAGSEIVIKRNSRVLFSPVDFQNIARVKKMLLGDYEEELSEESFQDLIVNNQIRKLESEDVEILILPNYNHSYHLFTFKNKLIFMAT